MADTLDSLLRLLSPAEIQLYPLIALFPEESGEDDPILPLALVSVEFKPPEGLL